MIAQNMVDFVVRAKNEGWGYFLGGQGQVCTQEWLDSLVRAGKATQSYCNSARRWIGRVVVDCSGLLVEAFRSENPAYGDRRADTFFAQCVESGKISTIPEIPGLCVHKSGHIGIYIGGGQVIEARGVAYGVVQTALKSRSWTHWGKLRDVDYSDVGGGSGSGSEPQPVLPFILTRILKKGATGEDVKELQKALNAVGYSLEVDGEFGPLTDAAVRAYQESRNLEVDGQVGPQTSAALGWTWGQENTPPAFTVGRLLKKTTIMMRGDDVGSVQIALKAKGFDCGLVDDIFGNLTKAAVIAFQTAYGLEADGIVGEQTTKALGGVWTGK
jgi:hypothetical protein